jgi:hypothetical protein
MGLWLPKNFALAFGGHEPTKLGVRVAGCARGTWPIKMYVDLAGDMYLGRGWGAFSRAHNLQIRILSFKYNGVDAFSVKVYDIYNYRKIYHIDRTTSSISYA